MFVIGITGNIGSGKSTVAGFLRELGAEVIDADKVGHSVYLPGSEGWKAVVEAFGKGVAAPDGSIDRRKLGEIVFKDPAAMERLTSIVWPLVSIGVRQQLDCLREKGTAVAVVEAIQLVNAGWKPIVDELWVTTAPVEVIYKRMESKWNWTHAQVNERLRAQLQVPEHLKFANRVIDTNVPLPRLKARVASLWKEVQKKAGHS
jgi:dephospho-CoA kinase